MNNFTFITSYFWLIPYLPNFQIFEHHCSLYLSQKFFDKIRRPKIGNKSGYFGIIGVKK